MTGRGAEPLGPFRAELGEGPVWNAAAGRIDWLDVPGQRWLSTDPATGETAGTALPRRCSRLLPRAGGGWVGACGRDLVAFGPEGPGAVLATLPEDAAGRFNDAACDRAGRLWIGTATATGVPVCGLWCFAPGAAPRLAVPGIAMSNGIGFSPDDRVIYFTDSSARTVHAADFDLPSGRLAGRRVFLRLPEGQLPDGLAVDCEGNVWLAVWGAGAVLCLAPDGSLRRRIALPTPRVSSCAFGGPQLSTLFVTTAREGAGAAERRADPWMGALFLVTTGARGLPMPAFAG